MELRRGTLRAASSGTLRETAAAWLEGAVGHKLRSGRHVGLVFGTSYTQPFTPSGASGRMPPGRASLEPIDLHECRHTFASLMIAAGVNAKSLNAYMGHSSVTITLDRYGHPMPGSESEAASLLDAYLVRAVARAPACRVTSLPPAPKLRCAR